MSGESCFDFIDRPPRSAKPRKTGLTVCSDTGLSIADAKSLVEVGGRIIDHVKYVDHGGVLWNYPPEWVKEKNAYYRSVGIPTMPGGVPFQVAAVQGKVPQFMERVASLSYWGVEVSADTLASLPLPDRSASIRIGVEHGLVVFTELGRKFNDRPLDPNEAIDFAHKDIEDGAHLVVVEKGDLVQIIREKKDTIHRIVEGVSAENLIFEPGPGDDVFENAKWLITEFGTETNLENLHPYTILPIENMRHGLHRAVQHRYFDAFKNIPLPAIA